MTDEATIEAIKNIFGADIVDTVEDGRLSLPHCKIDSTDHFLGSRYSQKGISIKFKNGRRVIVYTSEWGWIQSTDEYLKARKWEQEKSFDTAIDSP